VIRFDSSGLAQTRWYEYASRFVFGGIVTVLTGVIAHAFGPTLGGLFLAFPAIFPSSASLIEKHQREKRERAGVGGTKRGRIAAGIDAVGAVMGCAGLGVFALIAWKLLPWRSTWITLLIATAGWTATAVLAWFFRKHGVRRLGRLMRSRR
jgi:hypothetical protein